MSSDQIGSFCATAAIGAITFATVYEYRIDLAKFIRERHIRQLTTGAVIAMLTVGAMILMTSAFLLSLR